MKEQLIIDPTTVYEIDMECLQKKQEQTMESEGELRKQSTGVPVCPKSVGESRKRPAGVPLCPENTGESRKHPAGVPLCPGNTGNSRKEPAR